MQFFVDVVKASLDGIVVLETLVVWEESTRGGGRLIVDVVVGGRLTDVTVARYVTLIMIGSTTICVLRTYERGHNSRSLQAWM